MGDAKRKSYEEPRKIMHCDIFGNKSEFAVMEIVGIGSNSVVFRAVSKSKRQFALKVLLCNRAGCNARERFLRESRLLYGAMSDHIVSVHCHGLLNQEIELTQLEQQKLNANVYPENRQNGRQSHFELSERNPYMICTYADGSSVMETLQKHGAICRRDALKIALSVSMALEDIAKHGEFVAHRDIKPSNILLSSQHGPLLSDFGVCKTSLEVERSIHTISAGTPRYMSPEQLADSTQVDIRSDIYSLGVSLYEMLMGKSPWQVEGNIPIRDSTQLPSIGDGYMERRIELVLSTMTQSDPGRRYSGPGELSDELRRLIAEEEEARLPDSGYSLERYVGE